MRPVGGDAEQAVDVRVVAASRVDLSLGGGADREHLRALVRRHGLLAEESE